MLGISAFRRKSPAQKESYQTHIGDKPIKVNVYVEARSAVRASITKTGIHIRLPKALPKDLRKQQVTKMLDWARQKIAQRPELLHQKAGRQYHDGYELQVGNTLFTIRSKSSQQKTSTVSLKGSTVNIKLAKGLTTQDSEIVSNLVARGVAKHFQPYVEERVRSLNERYFQKEIKAVRLKNNSSNWGSCSRKKNINISTRLLFAPKQVIDYVIVHELAHLVELNHSPRFWAQVARVMPDYEKAEAWLKQHGRDYFF